MIRNLEAVFGQSLGQQYRNNYLEQFLSGLHVHILGQGERQEENIHHLENFLLPSFLLVCYEQGSVTLQHNGQTTKLEPGSFYIFEPFELYNGKQTSKEPIAYKYIYFDILPISARSIFKKYAFSGDNSYFQEEWYHTVGKDLLKNACETTSRLNHGSEFLIQYAIRGIVAYIMFSRTFHNEGSKHLMPNKSTAILDQAFAYTEQHLKEPINIAKIVRYIGTSRSTIDRVFLDVMQVSPVKALTRYKASQALAILQSGKSVKEASVELGYSSIFHFSNTFKTIFGMSPRAYLKS